MWWLNFFSSYPTLVSFETLHSFSRKLEIPNYLCNKIKMKSNHARGMYNSWAHLYCRLPYVEAVILESQRLVPVVPIIGPRRVLRDTKLLDYDIPRDSIVLMNLHSINSDPKLYPEPRSFKPERFFNNGTRLRDDNLMFFSRGEWDCSLLRCFHIIIICSIRYNYPRYSQFSIAHKNMTVAQTPS